MARKRRCGLTGNSLLDMERIIEMWLLSVNARCATLAPRLGMINTIERYSSTTRRRRLGSFRWRVVRLVLVALVLYLVVSRFVVGTFRIDSVSMEPALKPGDKVIASFVSFGGRIPLLNVRVPGADTPARGDLVVVRPPYYDDSSLISRLAEPFVNFFTLQRATAFRDLDQSRARGCVVKRIIGMPGDAIRMSAFSVSVRAKGGSQFISEAALVGPDIRLSTDISASGWQPSLPFSGNADQIVLGENQYFVLGDNRPQSSDSRSYGPVSRDRILAKVVFRYWPLNAFGGL